MNIGSVEHWLRWFVAKLAARHYLNQCWPKNEMLGFRHYIDVIMSMMVSQITSVFIVHSTVCSGADQRKHQSSVSLAFVGEFTSDWRIPPPKSLVMQKMFLFDDVIMALLYPMRLNRVPDNEMNVWDMLLFWTRTHFYSQTHGRLHEVLLLDEDEQPRLLHSLSLVAIGLSVGY